MNEQRNSSVAIGNGNANPTIGEIPAEVMESIDKHIAENGKATTEPPEYRGSVARTMFDTSAAEDGTVTVLIPAANMQKLSNQSLVRVKSVHDGRSYLGAVVRGPFAEPDGLRADAPVLVTATVRGGLLMPKFHGRVQVSLIGEETEDGGLIPPRRRPLPNSAVFVLDSDETRRILNSQGDICIGLADGLEDVEVRVSSTNKFVFPRHLGILGTTGGGKSTTVAGLVSKFQASGMAVVLLDTEGEYTTLNEPTMDARMLKALERRKLQAAGVPNTHLLRLVGRVSANPKHPKQSEFSLRFADLSPHALVEILGLTDAQEERFIRSYDATKVVMERLRIFPVTDQDRQEVLEIDELDEGYPRMELGHLYEIVKIVAAVMNKVDLETVALFHPQLKGKTGEINTILTAMDLPKSGPSWRALQGRLGRIHRLGIFDSRGAKPLDYAAMLKPGHVSILDLSDTDSPQINNLVIAQMLRGIQRQQDDNYKAAVLAGQKRPTPAMVLIEEAHEFLSAERIRQMPVLFQQVARIAKRGRKRWLGLGFITQLPQHLPDEVLGLINNWILHKIGDSNVISRLRKSIGGIDDVLWQRMLSLAPGQAITLFSGLVRPLQVAVDPTPAKLQMVD
ncbi:MAG: ATP-binding protein [Tepidisphaeraceae bacterium]|jgi:DNA helicase HerA-like ATPase